MLTAISNPEFAALRADIESHPRLCGYYIIDLVSIHDLRSTGVPQETILETLINYFDDDPTEPDTVLVNDQQWSDYEATIDRARVHTIESLVGGRQIGHIDETMSESIAAKLFDRFVVLCGPNPRFYIGLGIGDREYVFMYGVLVVADNLAGILWVVESD